MKNNKSIYIVGIFMLITMVSIGYAILTGQLNINGTAKVKAASWDIYFKNVKVKNGSVTASVKPSIIDKTTVNFEVELSKPGDFYEFNVDVVNDGMIDAMIESITILPDISDKSYLEYSVKYLDDSLVEEKDILHAKKVRTLKIKVEYLKSVENDELNKNDETLNVHVEIKYVQADATGKVPTAADKNASPWIVVTGDGTHVGDELAIGDEQFYVISNDGENITMLAKYNLLVGKQCDKNGANCVALTNPTGIQDATAKGYDESNPRIATVPFNNSSAYWGSVSNGKYVYNDNASIKEYVDNYKNHLESLGTTIEEARLISYDELVSLGCNPSSNTCSSALSWVYATTYWSGSAGNMLAIWHVYSNGSVAIDRYCYDSNYGGVRPVIVISVDEI